MIENIDWAVFSPQEKEHIEKLLELRMPEHLAASIINMDRKKEVELQKIIAQVRPVNSSAEQQLREKVITEFYKVHPRGPQTPDEEKILQEQLDLELMKFHEDQQAKANQQAELLKTIN